MCILGGIHKVGVKGHVCNLISNSSQMKVLYQASIFPIYRAELATQNV